MALTIVALQARPDLDVLLSGGILACAASRGHQVIAVSAQRSGDRGVRQQDLLHANRALGVVQVLPLGCDLDTAGLEIPAIHLASLIEAAGADVVIGYARGTPTAAQDDVRAHLLARRARDLARTPILLESRLPGDGRGAPRHLTLRSIPKVSSSSSITRAPQAVVRVVHVEPFVSAKLIAWEALLPSRARGGSQLRSLDSLLALPAPWTRVGLEREWYEEEGHSPANDSAFA